MRSPGPEGDVLDAILRTAARVPDHRKLSPWRFIVIRGEARCRLGEGLRRTFEAENAGLPDDRYAFEGERLLRAPVVVAVVSVPVECRKGTPVWEQELSAGAVCLGLLQAAQARGFGAQWLTEWLAYDAGFAEALGVKKAERIAGLMYLGTVDVPPTERPRPDMDTIVAYLES